VAYRETGKLEALATSHGPDFRPEDEAPGEPPAAADEQ